MKQRIVSSRDGTAKTSLFGALPFPLRKVHCLFEQILRVGHIRLNPRLFFELSLFGLAAEIEISLQSKLLRLNLTQNQIRNAAGNLAKEWSFAGGIL
ncbi:MAG: hypothetical protein NTV52_36530 [Acidobacteria bacterium]|nr:hypothetical protein [Acidobacteriota bacterium]